MFSACSIVTAIYQEIRLNTELNPENYKELADMIYTTRKQLDKLGIFCELLPNVPPFSIQCDGRQFERLDLAGYKDTMGEALNDALSDVNEFDRLYLVGLSWLICRN